MSPASLTGLLASCSGVVMALSPLLQARRVVEIRDSSEVSQAFVCVLIGNACVWILHGIVTSQVVLVVPNMVTIAAAGATLAIVRRFRHGGHGAHGAEDGEPATATAPAAGAHAATGAVVHDEHQPARVHAGAGARTRRASVLTRR